ncbi:large conductance mechanosensitive channel protein MscL [Pseudobacteriovorax antillogorgiicola]|uniref:Large conductance mechanosensitive channel n=1 Tax=Pseudobacteriovorax antillogorgiicola TaxID=1513793 RepID=A0A1Y6CWM1_9BACT|nr:large conductance mechanosensitive channel protein MscL [Pseudobacteriovorax antillogorgiicola]TCS41269.1 large conductance mechanosensitive channel [Pseudobacteriovorax antillogorgiicola]SMF83793.1 large conductance mechanosensitive channel [Pseudobacteriovorax antillogorgiicola]
MKFWKDFGSLLDLAVGILIGAAFNKIVQSLVTDILTPLIGIFLGEVSVSQWVWSYQLPLMDKVVEIRYGSFLQACLDFFIIAILVFIIVRLVKQLRDKAEDPKDTSIPTPRDIAILSEIRDLLKEKNQP